MKLLLLSLAGCGSGEHDNDVWFCILPQLFQPFQASECRSLAANVCRRRGQFFSILLTSLRSVDLSKGQFWKVAFLVTSLVLRTRKTNKLWTASCFAVWRPEKKIVYIAFLKLRVYPTRWLSVWTWHLLKGLDVFVIFCDVLLCISVFYSNMFLLISLPTIVCLPSFIDEQCSYCSAIVRALEEKPRGTRLWAHSLRTLSELRTKLSAGNCSISFLPCCIPYLRLAWSLASWLHAVLSWPWQSHQRPKEWCLAANE